MIIRNKYETLVLPKIHLIKFWILQGFNEEEIAQRLGVSVPLLRKYKKESEALAEAFKSGREEILFEVEESLFKKATGFVYTEEKIVDKGDKIEVTTTKKEVPPDMSAISLILKTYAPEKWGKKDDANEETQIGGVVILPEIMDEEG